MTSWKHIITALVAFIAGLVVYDVFLVDLYLETKTSNSTEYVQCPTTDNFNEAWNRWSYDYLLANPGVDIGTQMSDWNALMIQNVCDEKWLNPLDDLIEDYMATTTNP